jgi:hypothetical protein
VGRDLRERAAAREGEGRKHANAISSHGGACRFAPWCRDRRVKGGRHAARTGEGGAREAAM